MAATLRFFPIWRISVLTLIAGCVAMATAATHSAVSPEFEMDLRRSLPSRLINLSTRGMIRPGETLTPGFVLSGSGEKQLVIRAIGPALTGFGVAGSLSDTRLEVIRAGTTAVMLSNDNWGGTPALVEAFVSVGAFPLAATSLDAAVHASFMVGAYSVRSTPAGGAVSGIALAEVYDAGSSATESKLINLSTLGFVGTGANVLTAGFVILGDLPMTVLIRAVGPGLSPFGVSESLADPHLVVFSTNPQTVAASNDDWGGTPALQAVFHATGAFALSATSRDAAIVVQLQPGSYTAVVAGVGETTGNALVEVYEVPPSSVVAAVQ